MAMDQKARSAKTPAKRKKVGEEELRHRVRAGEKQMLADLMAWTEDTEQASVIAGSLRYAHSHGPDGAWKALRSRHEIVVSENVARIFRNESLAELKRNPGDEVIAPRLESA